MEKYKKHLFILVCATAALTLYLVVYYSDSRQYVRMVRGVVNEKSGSESDLKGGQTPIETIGLLSDSLKVDGIDPSLKFFIPRARDLVRSNLVELVAIGGLEELISQLEAISENEVSYFSDIAEVKYSTGVPVARKTVIGGQELVIPSGTYFGVIIFEKHIGGMWVIRAI